MTEHGEVLFSEVFTHQALSSRPMLTTGGLTLTGRQAYEACQLRQSQLWDAGVRPGDVVGLVGDTSLGFAIDLLSLLGLGAIIAPLSPSFHGLRAAQQWDFLGLKWVINHPPTDVFAGVYDIGRSTSPPAAGQVSAVVEELFSAVQLTRWQPPVTRTYPPGVCLLPMTSGTTGQARAVMLTAAQLTANVRQFGQACNLHKTTVALSLLPMTHIYGLTVLLLAPLAAGGHVVCEPFRADRFLSLHEQWQVTVSFIAPPMAPLYGGGSSSSTEPLAALETIVSGAAALRAADVETLTTHTGAFLAQGYGLTEASPVTHLRRSSAQPATSIGTPLPDTRDRIVDPATGLAVADGTVGELQVAGPQVMLGYAFAPEATAAALTEDGWLRTGDLGFRDPASGAIVLVGRLKDIINYHGYTVTPHVVEQAIATCALVEDVVCGALIDEDGEEVVAALIVPRVPNPSGDDAGEKDDPTRRSAASLDAICSALITELPQVLAPFELPRQIALVTEVPRTVTGKIVRQELFHSSHTWHHLVYPRS
ncbi:class I adenylate-forming enzyme family protein [Corynebacterium choanae]|nr:class I adenylate-forming enzyme family protein [Corynebacterium choanae]